MSKRCLSRRAFARSSTFALTNVTLPYALQIADQGWRQAAQKNPEIATGLNLVCGQITNEPVARAHRMPYVPWAKLAGA